MRSVRPARPGVSGGCELRASPYPHLHPLPSRTVSLDPHTTAGNDHAVNVYTSPDLARWTPAGDALPVGARPTGIYFRPKVVYNAASKSYVMWINYLAPASSPLEVGPPPPTRAHAPSLQRSPAFSHICRP